MQREEERLTDQEVYPIRIGRERWNSILDVEDRKRTMLLTRRKATARLTKSASSPSISSNKLNRKEKQEEELSQGRRIITQLIQQHPQRPNIALLVDHPPLIDIHHLRRPVLHRRMTLDINLHLLHLLDGRGRGARDRDGAKVAELEGGGGGLENVFDFEVAVNEGRGERVHFGNTLQDRRIDEECRVGVEEGWDGRKEEGKASSVSKEGERQGIEWAGRGAEEGDG
jgi:hypothetical protein